MSAEPPLLPARESGPPPLRGPLRRASRWLIPGLALLLAPTPALAVAGLIGAGAWLGTRLWVAARRSRPLAPTTATHRIELGLDASGRSVSLDEQQLGAHGLIVGASGSGKSTTLLTIAAQQILHGRPVVMIDLKGSLELAAQLRAAAGAAGRPLRIWTPDGPEHWNPLAHGNATELKDKLISTERFSEPHYQRAAERYVQLAIQVIGELRPAREPSLAQVVELLDPRRLGQMTRQLAPARRNALQEYLTALTPDQLSAVRGLQSRLAVISESHTGAFLEPAAGAIDLRRALAGPEVVLFSLNSSTYGQLAAQLGTLALQDLVTATGARERAGRPQPPATVAIDEFSALGADHVMALVARGRSAGVSVLLATQELADLDSVSRGFRQQVIGSTAVKIAHRQDVSESARAIAALTGTTRVWEQSYSRPTGLLGSSGSARVNTRPVDRPRVDPSLIQDLPTGASVVITKLPRSETRLTRIRPLVLGRGRSEPGRER